MKRILAVWLAVLLTATVVEAFNISPFTYKLRSRATPADSAYILNGSIYLTEMDSAIALILKARNKLIADSIQGSGTATGVLDSAFLLDADSTAGLAIIWFGGHGAGIKWQRSTDSLYWTRDGSTWVNFGTGSGSGSSTTNADSLGHKIARMAYATNGYVLAFDHDSLYWKADATGAGADSDAIRYRTDRIEPYSDTGLAFGKPGDSLVILIDTTNDCLIFYTEGYSRIVTPDSSVFNTWHRIATEIGDSVSGLISGINSTNGITGGASMGTATLQLDGSAFYVHGDTVKIFNNNTGRLIFNVFGTPTDVNEMVIAENQITFGSGITVSGLTNTSLTIADGYRKSAVADSAYATWGRINAAIGAAGGGDITGVTLGNGGTESPAGGASGNVTANVVAGTSTGLAVNADSVYVTTIPDAKIATTLLRDSEWNDSIAAARTVNSIWTLSANWVNTANPWADNEVADNVHAGVADSSVKYDTATTLQWAEGRTIAHDTLWGNSPGFLLKSLFKDSVVATGAKIPKAALADSSIKSDTSITLQWAEGRLIAHDTLWANSPGFLLRSLFKDSVVATGAKIPKAALADSSIKSDTSITLQWAEGRTIAHDTLWGNSPGFATKANVHDSVYAPGFATKANVRDSIWNSAKVAEKLPSVNFKDSLGTGRVTSTIILDGTIASGDIATGAIDSIRLGTACVKPAEIDSTLIYPFSGSRIYNMLYCNQIATESTGVSISIGSGSAGLTISNALTLGSDITDDSLVTEWNPEFPNMVLYRGGSTLDAAYMDSTLFKIYGGADSTDGNFIIFHDSILTTGNQRRHIAIEIPVPDRVDSLRRVTIQCMSKQYTATSDEFFIVAKLLKTPVTWSSLDSLYVDSTALSGNAHRLLDVDSSASASLTTLHLNPPATANWAVTPFTSRYLVITGRRDAGSVFQWGKVYKIQMVWSRTRI